MYCTQCGDQLPDDARFCPSCGTPVVREPGMSGGGEDTGATVARPSTDQTTDAIEIGALDQQEQVDDLPQLEPGTGMLVVVRGPNAGSRFLIDRETTTIGRHPESHIFLDDVTVSRRHAEVARSGGQFTLHDGGSLNGTYANGVRVDERTLVSGDELQVGRFKLMYVGSDPTGGA